ncbi:MAG: allantoinase, partial [Psychrosphaera sp.]|nr:allantoinase [Psychrosphaera sp.]
MKPEPINHFALRSSRVVAGGEMIDACVEVKNGKIKTVHAHDVQLDCPIEELGNQVLMPGLVDSHVH